MLLHRMLLHTLLTDDTWASLRSSSSDDGRFQSRKISGASVTVISSTLSKLTDRSKQVAHTFSWRLSTKFLSKRSAACWICQATETASQGAPCQKEGHDPQLSSQKTKKPLHAQP